MFKQGFMLLCTTSCLYGNAVLACDTPESRKQVVANETAALLAHPKALSHGWEDGNIQLSITSITLDADGHCEANLQLTLPQGDLDAVNQHLDQNPAKRILLGAQGYSVPSTNQIAVPYRFTLAGSAQTTDITPHNDENRPLKDLHNSLEFMYQLLTQLGAEVSTSEQNVQPWPAERQSQWLSACRNEFVNATDAACTCKLEKLSSTYTTRQMELIEDLQSHPYSATSQALISFKQRNKVFNKACSIDS